LHDLVSYNGKHNEANRDDNKDGSDDNDSWNCGGEGNTDDPAIQQLREQQKRNFLASLMFSQGVPILCGGDELGRTQGGNNNSYCQDTEISWHDWNLDDKRKALLEFTSRLIQYRREHPNFHRRSFYEQDPSVGLQKANVRWIRADGAPMTEADWNEGGWMRTVAMFPPGDAPEIRDRTGQPIQDDDFLLLMNSHHENVPFRVPEDLDPAQWTVEFDTAGDKQPGREEKAGADGKVDLHARSFMLLRRPRVQTAAPA